MTEIVIAGDSHIEALGVPIKSSDGTYQLPALTSHGEGILGMVGGAWPRNFDAYWQATKVVAKGRVVAISWGGNIHLARFLFAPDPLFDFVASDAPDLPLDRSGVIVPEAAVQVMFAEPILKIEKALEELKSVAHKVLYFGSPPPKGDDSFVRERLRREKFFVNLLQAKNTDLGEVQISPAFLRLKFWHALQRLMREAAERTGATFVPAPEDGKTEFGFLHRDCYAMDVSHANKTYGSRVVQNLRRFA